MILIEYQIFLEDDFNRIVDFLIHFWVSSQNFINVLCMFLDKFAVEAINSIQWNHNLDLTCKYILYHLSMSII